MIDDRTLRRALAFQAHVMRTGGPEGRLAQEKLDALMDRHPELEVYLQGGGESNFEVRPWSPWHLDLALALGSNLNVTVSPDGLRFSGDLLDVVRMRVAWSREERRLSALLESVAQVYLDATEEPDSCDDQSSWDMDEMREVLFGGGQHTPPPLPWWGEFLTAREERRICLPAGRRRSEFESMTRAMLASFREGDP